MSIDPKIKDGIYDNLSTVISANNLLVGAAASFGSPDMGGKNYETGIRKVRSAQKMLQRLIAETNGLPQTT